MTKAQILDTLMLLSALESWGFSNGQTLPDYVIEDLQKVIKALKAEVLK